MLQDLKKFALRGNVVDMAVGFTVGAAFATVVKSLVNDLLMPPIGMLTGGMDFADHYWLLRAGSAQAPPYATLADAQSAGSVTVNYGVFVNNLIAFAIVVLAMFVVVRALQRTERKLEERFGHDKPEPGEPDQKKCPYCLSTIAYRATRCPQCTSQLGQQAEG